VTQQTLPFLLAPAEMCQHKMHLEYILINGNRTVETIYICKEKRRTTWSDISTPTLQNVSHKLCIIAIYCTLQKYQTCGVPTLYCRRFIYIIRSEVQRN
jgi:hypothetical protein